MSDSSVPGLQFTTAGIIVPPTNEVLAGVQADMDSAFGGGLNPALETPQGQLASSQTAIIDDKNAEFVYFSNQVDPLYSDGKFQDAIGRIYFITRKPATATVVTATLTGVAGAVIAAGALAQDTSGNTYVLTGDVTIGLGGTVDGQFENIVTGPIACPADTLIQVYQAVAGWDAINNDNAGTIGRDVESRADFEYRRRNSVALNGRGTPQAIYANVFEVDNVLDVYAIDNPAGRASFVGSISGTTLTISSLLVGSLSLNHEISGVGISAGTKIVAIGGGNTYTVNISQTVSSTDMTAGNVLIGASNYPLVPNSVYAAVVGGLDADVAQAIWDKKDTGCDYNGNTTVTVIDDVGYAYPQPSYTVKFERPAALPIKFEVSIVDDPTLPTDIVSRIKNAIITRFNGSDGGTRERIGASVYASRYYSAVATSADNVSIINILIGTGVVNLTIIPVGIDQNPTINESDIVVTLV